MFFFIIIMQAQLYISTDTHFTSYICDPIFTSGAQGKRVVIKRAH